MMPLASYFILPDAWPTWAILILAAIGVTGWVVLHKSARPLASVSTAAGARNVTVILARVALAIVGVWLSMQFLVRLLRLETRWPLWLLTAAAVLGAEALIWLYGLERKVVSRRMGMVLVGLRLGLLSLMVLMLLQPVIAASWTTMHKRSLAVMLDESASMQIRDAQLSPAQRLRLAESLGLAAAKRPFRLEQISGELIAVREQLAGEQAWLDQIVQTKRETSRAQLAARRGQLNKKLAGACDSVSAQAAAMDEILKSGRLPKPQETALRDAKVSLATLVSPRLLDASAKTGQEQAAQLADNLEKLQDGVGRAQAELARVVPALEAVAAAADAALYNQLAKRDQAAVDTVASLTRAELARAALLHKNYKGQSLLDQLAAKYDLKVYTFSAGAERVDPRTWTDPLAALDKAPPPASTSTSPASAPARAADDPAMRTAYFAALRKFIAEAGSEPAGVLMLSDGQDNGQENVEPLARQLGSAGGVFSAVLVGAEKPPTDAAVISVDAPDAVYLSDKLLLTARLKLDGLDRRNVRVSLLDGDKIADTQTVQVSGDSFRTTLQLADEPKTACLHSYRVEIEPQPGEVFCANNSYPVTISVTDEQTKMLLVDDRPRWEFRYLKNLFMERDKSVRLQHVLLHPDVIAGQALRPDVPASTSRPAGLEEATLLPASESEWLKFDVVVIGDLDRQQLSEKDLKALRKFVADRGGTAIFLAGPNGMPGAFAGTPLAELLPLQLGNADQPAASQPTPTGGFAVGLTDLGKESTLMRLDSQAERSEEVWQNLPPFYRRSPYLEASPAGSVLAYALDPGSPRWLTEGEPEATTNPDALARRRLDYQRRHALIVTAQVGYGKVLVLNTDCTWRLRYRSGDLYHHRFWGQVLRWATAGKLPSGTSTVKIGTDRTRYAPGERPVVRAKLIREDYSPVVANDVSVCVRQGEKSIAHVPMKYQSDSPGMYAATLDALPAGAYELELEGQTVKDMLAKEAALTTRPADQPARVATTMSVDPSSGSEEVELAANRGLLVRLAGLSAGGAVAPVDQAERAIASLPAGEYRQERRFQLDLWDSWILLGLFIAAATTEWILRKRVGLA